MESCQIFFSYYIKKINNIYYKEKNYFLNLNLFSYKKYNLLTKKKLFF